LTVALNYYNFQRESLPHDAAELKDKEDEQPVVVVLKPGDLTAEEAANIRKEGKKLK
jgi:DNA recombination-dependent growth factor C